MKSLGHDADHFERSAVDGDRFSEDVRIGRKRLLPEVITEHCNCAASRGSVVGREDGATKQWLSPEDAEVISRDKIGRCKQGGRICVWGADGPDAHLVDRKSTRLNSS